jgi:hypothetical protein
MTYNILFRKIKNKNVINIQNILICVHMLHASGVKNHEIYHAMPLTSNGGRINTKSAQYTLII